MNVKSIIQAGIEYIEENLATSIEAAELAKEAGFSVYHYYRLFQNATGFPVMQFILRRRLLHGVYAISQGMTAADAALRFGFDTYAGFYKAFRREFGLTATEYIKAGRAKRPLKINLFREEHMEISKKKANQILSNWNLSHLEIRDIYYEGTGNRNENAFYVGDEYVMKFTCNLGRMKTSAALARVMEDTGMNVAAFVPTLDGMEYLQDGEMFFCLTERLPGHQLSPAHLLASGGLETARCVGELIGQLHKALAKLDVPLDEPELLATVRDWALPESKRILELEDGFVQMVQERLKTLLPTLPSQIIHRDPNPGNIIGEEGRWAFIDFDLAEKNVRIFDPIYASTAVLSEIFSETKPEIGEKWLEVYHNIALGYNAVVGMTVEEKQAYPYVLLANQMICVAWFAGQEKYPEAFEKNKGMTRWMIRNFDRLTLE